MMECHWWQFCYGNVMWYRKKEVMHASPCWWFLYSLESRATTKQEVLNRENPTSSGGKIENKRTLVSQLQYFNELVGIFSLIFISSSMCHVAKPCGSLQCAWPWGELCINFVPLGSFCTFAQFQECMHSAGFSYRKRRNCKEILTTCH